MKKNLLLLTALSVMVTACYSTIDQEKDILAVRRDKQAVEGCQPMKTAYQHAGYRACVEETQAKIDSQPKTVYITETQEGGALVIPRVEGASEMLDSDEYPVVDVRTKDAAVVSEASYTTVTTETTDTAEVTKVVTETVVAKTEPVVEEVETEEITIEAPAETPVVEESEKESLPSEEK
ncbi:MAG: hypothetical protein ILP11_00255 [Alphaproteobacteria bacterium]|nr:hypothetical protein [Alphaproteobacteria bacterium]